MTSFKHKGKSTKITAIGRQQINLEMSTEENIFDGIINAMQFRIQG